MQHFLKFDQTKVEAYHFSKDSIEIGQIIKSNMDISTNVYSYLYKAYKKVADELNLYYPIIYGYAYPAYKKMPHKYCYKVEANSKFVTKCDYRYSIQILLENSFFSPLSLNYALKKNNINSLYAHAFKYFNPTQIEYTELISDQFRVIEIISRPDINSVS